MCCYIWLVYELEYICNNLKLTYWFHFCVLFFSLSFYLSIYLCLGLWECEDYLLWDRNTQSALVEFMPNAIAKATFLVYAFDGFATRIQMNRVFFDVSTQWCG